MNLFSVAATVLALHLSVVSMSPSLEVRGPEGTVYPGDHFLIAVTLSGVPLSEAKPPVLHFQKELTVHRSVVRQLTSPAGSALEYTYDVTIENPGEYRLASAEWTGSSMYLKTPPFSIRVIRRPRSFIVLWVGIGLLCFFVILYLLYRAFRGVRIRRVQVKPDDVAVAELDEVGKLIGVDNHAVFSKIDQFCRLMWSDSELTRMLDLENQAYRQVRQEVFFGNGVPTDEQCRTFLRIIHSVISSGKIP